MHLVPILLPLNDDDGRRDRDDTALCDVTVAPSLASQLLSRQARAFVRCVATALHGSSGHGCFG